MSAETVRHSSAYIILYKLWLVQVIAYGLLDIFPLPELTTEPMGRTPIEFESKYNNLNLQKLLWKCR